MKDAGNHILASNANWTFSGEVATHFDSHVSKSVPLYHKGHDLICELSDFFITDDSVVYELGTSTGELLIKLSKRTKRSAQFIGIDIQKNMIEIANKKKEESKINNVSFKVDDVLNCDFQTSDFIISYYTLQFIQPKHRQELIDKIYNSLNWGGAFVIFEKVRAPDARFQDIMTLLYSEFKLKNEYTAEQILAKTRSLKGILEPFSTQGNIDLFKRANFFNIMTIMKYICFEGFLLIK